MTVTGNQGPTDGSGTDSTRRILDSESRPESGTGREVILFFALGIILSLSAIGIGIFGTANVADWVFSTVEARWTSTVEQRDRAAATQARQTDIAAAIELTDTAVPPADKTATSRAAALSAEPPADWRLIFSDQFTSNASDWPIFDESGRFTTHRTEITDGKYRWEAEAHQDFVWWVYPGSQQISDFHFSVQVRRISGNLDGDYGVVFRLKDGSYYRYVISDSGHFSVEKFSSDRWKQLIPMKWSAEIRPYEVNLLTVASSGPYFSFFINGQRVGEVADTQLESGFVGLTIGLGQAGHQAVFEFDNVEIWAPP